MVHSGCRVSGAFTAPARPSCQQQIRTGPHLSLHQLQGARELASLFPSAGTKHSGPPARSPDHGPFSARYVPGCCPCSVRSSSSVCLGRAPCTHSPELLMAEDACMLVQACSAQAIQRPGCFPGRRQGRQDRSPCCWEARCWQQGWQGRRRCQEACWWGGRPLSRPCQAHACQCPVMADVQTSEEAIVHAAAARECVHSTAIGRQVRAV